MAAGLARVQLDRHFFSDIVAGGVLGWCWAWAVLGCLRRPRPTKVPLEQSPPRSDEVPQEVAP
jgi:membrane-associated phospholipid phosphatase